VQQYSVAGGFQATERSPELPRLHLGARLAANDLASEKLRRLIVKHLGDFFSDTAEGFRILSDFRGLDDFLFDRQVLRPALSALVLVRTFGDWLQTFDAGYLRRRNPSREKRS